MINDDDSSEGIVASSDDEHAGLSEAVEYHIFNQADPTREDESRLHQRRPLKSHDDDRGVRPIWRGRRSPEFYEKRFRYQEEYHHHRLDDGIHNIHDRHHPPPPYHRPLQHHYGVEDPPPIRAPPTRYYDAPQSRTTCEVPLPPMHRRPMAESDWRRDRDRPPPYPPIPSRNVYSGEKAPVRHAHEDYVGHSGGHYMPKMCDHQYQDTDHRVKDTDLRMPRSKTLDSGHERFLHHDQYRQSLSNMYRDRNIPPRPTESAPRLGDLIKESLLKSEKKTEKLPPKPISFKIKSTKSEENSFHPLDRLAPATKNDKVSSPGRWLHDRYDDKESDATQETSGDVEPEKVSKDKLCEDSPNPRELKQDRESISTPQNSDSAFQKSESPEGLIHAKEHGNTVCEMVEAIVEEGECVEENKISKSSDEDEELLGLRLKALSSALAEDKKTTNFTKKKSRKRKSKNLIHRVHDTLQADKKKLNSSKSSAAAASILGRSSPFPSYEKSKSVGPKSSPSQLTLLGEMVKNHHPTEVLKKIKTKPEVARSSRASRSPTHKNKLSGQVTTSKEGTDKPKQTEIKYSPSAVNISKNNMVDNYDELEMDLELEDSESDSGLLPPGVDQTPLEEQVAQVSSSAGVIKSSKVAKGVEQAGNSTPSQESIWSMLEHASAHSDFVSNAEDNHEKEKIVKIQTAESRRLSFEDFDDDDAILKLRQSLLRQLDKNVKKDGEDNQPLFDAGKSAPLPSQFPYKPPQLRISSAAISTCASSVSALSTSTVPAVTTSPATSCIKTFTVQATPVISAGDLQSMSSATISTSTCSNDSSLKVLADTSITVQPTTNEVPTNTPRVFLPQTASTPAVNSQTPALRKVAKRRKRRRKSSATANIGALSEKAADVFDNDKAVVKPRQLSNILKPAVTNVAIALKQSSSHSTASKTLVKTATTIIRSTGMRSTVAAIKSASSPSKETLPRMKSSIDRPKPLLQLPRHQPVVVNIGSSDEEESIMSPDKHSISPNDPMQMQRDKVNEMVKQMRILTTARQNAATKSNIDNAPKSLLHSNLNSSTLISSSQKLSSAAKKLRLRFLKLGALINKDQIKFNQVTTAKAAKKVELKATEDELKQMMHRIAALESKKAKCEGILGQFCKQEKLIKNRLQKRNALIKDVGEKLQSRLKLSKQNIGTPEKMKQNTLVGKTTSPTSHPTSSTATKLDMEKQRLLARQQKLAEKISQMKKTEGVVGRKRSMLSNEVQSHLAKYRKTRTSSNPTAHDLSLNKIVISVPSPVKQSPAEEKSSEDARKKIEVELPKSKESEQLTIEDSFEQTSISDSSMKMRMIVASHITAYQPFASYEPVLSYEAEPFATKFWEQSTPVSIQKWRLTETEIPTAATVQKSQALGLIDTTYQSPLRLFRSYRLNPYLRVKEKLSIKSATFSHKIDPKRILCRYDLSGKCQDPNCTAQHVNQYLLTTDELFVDLLLYCPSLLGKNIASDTPHDLMEMARSACQKLLGVGTAQKNMSVDERCVLIASRINSSLGNKAPYTTIFKPRSIRLTQDKKKSLVLPVTVYKEKVEVGSAHEDNGTEEPGSNLEQTERYFVEDGKLDIKKLEDAVKKDPENTQLWLRLTEKTMKMKDSNRLELALHTMCLALEENTYSGELWAYYLNLLHERDGRQWSEDLDEMVAEAINIVPRSTYIWDLLLSWENNAMKMGILLDQLVSNIVKSVELEESQLKLTPEFLSNWLLETLLRKVQLALHRSGTDDALDQFSQMIDSCFQQRFWAITNSGRHCLLPNDFCILKLCFINFKHFKSLPRCFLPDIRPSDCTGMMHAVKIHKNVDAQLHFSSSVKLGDIFSSLLSDLNDSIEDCQIGAEVNMACFTLLWEKLRLLKAQECWDDAASLCRLISEKVQQSLVMEDLRFGFCIEKLHKILCDCIIISADCLAKLGNVHEATQVFEKAISDSKNVDGKLCFEAALLQSSVDSEDVEAVLVYLEACVSSFVKSDSDCLDANDLKLMLRHLLQLPFPKKRKIPEFIDGVSWATVNKAKSSLWLMYSLLLRTTGASNQLSFHYYEQAITDVADLSSKRELWLRYVRYRQALALSLSEAGKAKQQQWIRNFSLLVKRCLTSMSPQLSLEDVESRDSYYSDYTFHNQVSAVYLSCFSTRQQTASAYNFLVEIMPYNLLLILRACKFYLSHGDHHSVISTVWKITANTKCQNETLWKISISSHFLVGRIAKAVRLAKQAVESVPFSSQLWSDYLTLLKAYGMPAEFIEEKIRCSNILQIDATQLITDS